MDALRNLFDEKDLENAPSLFDNPANPAGVAESVASDAGGPAVVCARPQFRRRVADDPMIPVKLVCLWLLVCCCCFSEIREMIKKRERERKKASLVVNPWQKFRGD